MPKKEYVQKLVIIFRKGPKNGLISFKFLLKPCKTNIKIILNHLLIQFFTSYKYHPQNMIHKIGQIPILILLFTSQIPAITIDLRKKERIVMTELL